MFPQFDFFFHVDLYKGNTPFFFSQYWENYFVQEPGNANFGTVKNKLIQERGNAERKAKSEQCGNAGQRLYRNACPPLLRSIQTRIASAPHGCNVGLLITTSELGLTPLWLFC